MKLQPHRNVQLRSGHQQSASNRTQDLSASAVTAAKRTVTFRDPALAYIDVQKGGWTDPYARQWRDHFETYVFSKIGSLPLQVVNDIDVVLSMIEPLWNSRTQTAWRIRGPLEMVIDWAKFRGYCMGENAARWKGALGPPPAAPGKGPRCPTLPRVPLS